MVGLGLAPPPAMRLRSQCAGPRRDTHHPHPHPHSLLYSIQSFIDSTLHCHTYSSIKSLSIDRCKLRCCRTPFQSTTQHALGFLHPLLQSILPNSAFRFQHSIRALSRDSTRHISFARGFAPPLHHLREASVHPLDTTPTRFLFPQGPTLSNH